MAIIPFTPEEVLVPLLEQYYDDPDRLKGLEVVLIHDNPVIIANLDEINSRNVYKSPLEVVLEHANRRTVFKIDGYFERDNKVLFKLSLLNSNTAILVVDPSLLIPATDENKRPDPYCIKVSYKNPLLA